VCKLKLRNTRSSKRIVVMIVCPLHLLVQRSVLVLRTVVKIINITISFQAVSLPTATGQPTSLRHSVDPR